MAQTAGRTLAWADDANNGLVAASPAMGADVVQNAAAAESLSDMQAAITAWSAATEASVWTGKADTSWYNKNARSFTLSTPEQLAGLAQIVNGKASDIARDTFTGKTVTLAADVRLNPAGGKQEWTAIGDINLGVDHTTSTVIYFDGTFDGAGHKVYGLYMPNSSENYGGYHAFFGSLGPNAQVLKLGIESGEVSGRVAAGIAAVSHTEDVENIPQIVGCYNKADITGNGSTSRAAAGIFAGENQKGHEGNGEGYRAAAYIADCYNMGSVTSSGPCGGIAGTGSVKMYSCYNTGTVSSSVGGTMHGALMSNLFAPGSVTAASFQGAGEIVDCYAYVGTDSQLYRVLDADHTLENPAYPGEEWGDAYYNDSASFLDAEQMAEGSYWLGTAYVNDDSANPANGYMPLLWWQAGKAEIDLGTAIIAQIADQLYSGSAITPQLGVYIDDPDGGYEALQLNRGGDYRVVFKNNTAIGTATATVYGVGRYAGSAGTASFKIVQIDLSQCTIDEIAPQWFYGGAARPKVVVRAPGDTALSEGEDYTVTYADNTSSGMASVTVDSNGVSTTGQMHTSFFIVMASDHLEGAGTEDDPFLLSSKADLQFLSHMVNTDADSRYIDACYKVTQDIDAGPASENDLGIDPIGVNKHPFAGTFDGDGHTITLNMVASKLSASLNFNAYIYDYLGLFSCTGSAGTTTIKNLTVAGSVESEGTAAGFIGSAVDTQLIIENCTNAANVQATSAANGSGAGFIGVAAGTRLTMTDCLNTGTIKGVANASGIVVYLNGGSGQHVFTHCGNEGQIASSESAAGIIQHYAPTQRSSFVCENCYNTGMVVSSRADGGAAGGILGMDQSGSQNASIDKKCSFISCYNTGTVIGGRHAGGIAGQVFTTPMDFKGCYNTGSITDNSGIFGAGGICGAVSYKSKGWTFSSCYSAGSVSAKGTASKPGAIVGWLFSGSQVKLENCYMLDALSSGCDVEGIGAYNVAQGAQIPVSITGAATPLTAEQMVEKGQAGFAAKLGSIFSDDFSDPLTPLNAGMPVCYWQANNAKTDLASDEVTIASIEDQAYCGVPVEVALDVSLADGTKLIEGVDYQCEYSDNEIPGQATVVIQGIGRYRGQRTMTFAIVKGSIEACAIAPVPDQWSTESGAKPALSVTNPKGYDLMCGTDYTVAYADNTDTGTATATVTGAGYYEGTQEVQFKVVRAAESLEGAGTADDPYLIGAVADFAYFMAKVNAGESDYAFACYRLTADLDLEAESGKPSIDPVGTAKNRFRGQFDGDGHTVTLHIDAQGRYKGLFGVVDGAVIKNLTTDGSVVQTVDDVAYGEDKIGCVAAIVGYSFDALRMENCTNKASVTSNGSAVAGLVGIADAQGYSVEFVSCRNEGAITSSEELAAGLVTDVRAAKLVVRDCSNAGSIASEHMSAGLVGRPMGSVSETTKATVSNSFNIGVIVGKYRSGGLVGPVYSYTDVTVRNSFNTGGIASSLGNAYSSYASDGVGANGGLVGGVGAYSSLVIDRAYNAGLLTSTDSTMNLGGLAGYVSAGARQVKFTNAYYTGAPKSVGNQLLADSALVLDASSAASDTVLKSSTMPDKLGVEFGYDTFGVNGGYPIIGSQRVSMADCRVSPVASQTFTGAAIVPTLVVFDLDHMRALVEGRDYQLVCENNVNVTSGGQRAVAHIVGIGTYVGEIDVAFDIDAANLADCTIAGIPDQSWTGKAVEPGLSIVNDAGITLVVGTDYTVGYSNNVNVGTASVVVRGKGNYVGVLRTTFDIIERTDITDRAVIEPFGDALYTGNAVEPNIDVVLDGVPMLSEVEYTVEYFDNVEVGTARVVVTGKGAFTGSVEATFKIVPVDLSVAKVAPVGAYTYTGSEIKPEPAVTLNDKTLKKDADYTLSYRNNVNVGTAAIVITGKGAYKGSTTTSFTIKAMPVLDVIIDAPSGSAAQQANQESASAAKKANPMTVKANVKSVKASKLRAAKRTVKALVVKKAQGKVTYAKVKSGSSAKLSVNKKTGAITVKKGTKAGTYKVKVKVSAAGNAKYKAASKTVTVKVKVK